jgi:hypothetical protein
MAASGVWAAVGWRCHERLAGSSCSNKQQRSFSGYGESKCLRCLGPEARLAFGPKRQQYMHAARNVEQKTGLHARNASNTEKKRETQVKSASDAGVAVVVSSENGTPVPASDNADTEVKAVLFDMDGVLCDSEDRSRQAAVELFKEIGFEVTEEDFIPFMGTGEANFLGGVARKFGVPDWDVTKAKARFFEIYIGKVRHHLFKTSQMYPTDLIAVRQCSILHDKCCFAFADTCYRRHSPIARLLCMV